MPQSSKLYINSTAQTHTHAEAAIPYFEALTHLARYDSARNTLLMVRVRFVCFVLFADCILSSERVLRNCVHFNECINALGKAQDQRQLEVHISEHESLALPHSFIITALVSVLHTVGNRGAARACSGAGLAAS